MPFRSAKQRRYMHMAHPEIAQRWEDEAKRKKRSAVKKNLTPIGNMLVSKSDDFNSAAAEEMFGLIMKMDHDTASEFVYYLADAARDEYLDLHAEELRKDYIDEVERRLEAAKSRSIFKALETDETDQAEIIWQLSKAWEEFKKYDPHEPRDAGGRWTSAGHAIYHGTGPYLHNMPKGGDKNVYGRLAASSKFIGDVAGVAGLPHVALAAHAANYVGQHGAEAENVFGPATRRMAYRYRGTEKQPEPSLVRGYHEAVTYTRKQNGLDATKEPNSAEKRAGESFVADYLQRKQVPNDELIDLHLGSGHLPPSEGVLFNAKGQIVTQASGYGDDWYLPFNLKHLKNLKGGSYVRTRNRGGLTPEDVYTGLMSGARRVTVVSGSGVYTVDFQDDFRGGRRMNDKAKRMVDRYRKILDTVSSGKVARGEVNYTIKQAIAAKVKEEHPRATKEELRTATKQAVDEFRSNNDDPEEDKDLIGYVQAQLSDNPETVARLKADKNFDDKGKSDLSSMAAQLVGDEREQFWKLNAKGYADAQKALQQQFPYYIRSSYKPLQRDGKDVTKPNSKDEGYVRPRAVRTKHAYHGYYTDSPPQSAEYGRGRRSRPSETSAQPSSSETPREARAQSSAPEQRSSVASPEQRYRKVKAIDAAVALKNGPLKDVEPAKDEHGNPIPRGTLDDIDKMSDDEFKTWMRNPDNYVKFRDLMDKMANTSSEHREFLGEHYKAWKAANGAYEGVKFNHEAARNPDARFDFGDETADKSAALAKHGHWHGMTHDKPLSAMSDEELHHEIKAASLMDDMYPDEQIEEDDRQGAAERMRDEGISFATSDESRERTNDLMADPKKRGQHLKSVHLVKQVLHGTSDEDRSKNDVRVHEPVATAHPNRPTTQDSNRVKHDLLVHNDVLNEALQQLQERHLTDEKHGYPQLDAAAGHVDHILLNSDNPEDWVRALNEYEPEFTHAYYVTTAHRHGNQTPKWHRAVGSSS